MVRHDIHLQSGAKQTHKNCTGTAGGAIVEEVTPTATVQALLAGGANGEEGMAGSTPLHISAIHKHMKIV